MTGVCNALAADVNPVIVGTAVIADTKAGTNAIGNVGLTADGRMQFSGSGSSGPPNWWIVGNPGGGAPAPPTLYATLTVNSGTGPGTNPGALASTATGPVWQWTESVVGTLSANCTLKFYFDAGGTQFAGQLNFTVSVQRTS